MAHLTEKERGSMTPRWVQYSYGWVIVLALLAWGWGVSRAWSTGELWESYPPGPARIGHKAPRLSLQTPQNKPSSLRNYRGRWLLLNFWATWCAPCREEMDSLEKLAHLMKDQPFTLLAVSVDANWTVIHNFFRKHPTLRNRTLRMELALDPLGSQAQAYGSRKFPETYLLDPQGVVRYKWVGPFVWDSPQILQQIKVFVKNAAH